jgi:hypothetical protein
MLLKNMTHYGRCGMTKTRMPVWRRSTDTIERLRNCRNIQWVETLVASTSKEYVPCDSVLDKDIKRVKFNKDIIITSKFRNGEKIMSDRGNMENITKMKCTRWWCKKWCLTNMCNAHTWTISDVDSVGAALGLWVDRWPREFVTWSVATVSTY